MSAMGGERTFAGDQRRSSTAAKINPERLE
jgi:hypothetical protein